MIIILSMLFMTVEMLSMLFGHSFTQFQLFGLEINFITGVIYFCLGFWILDLITELYDDKMANLIIYGKIFCQLAFMALLHVGGSISNNIIAQSLNFIPKMVIAGIIASLIGYKLTSFIMQKLKIKYEGKHVTFRYIVSTLPGEIIFSFIYSAIFLWHEYHGAQYIKIFYSIILAKIFFSLLFSLLFSPIKKAISFFINFEYPHKISNNNITF